MLILPQCSIITFSNSCFIFRNDMCTLIKSSVAFHFNVEFPGKCNQIFQNFIAL